VSSNVIRIKPERSRLVAFARWATAQTPKIGTIGLGEFGVPAHQFVDAPEEVLIGAIVDGHRYVSPTEDAANGTPPPGHQHQEQEPAGAELLGVATPQALTAPGDPEADAAAMVAATSPETVRRAMDAVLLATDLAASDAAGGQDGEQESTGDGGPFICDLCSREFTTERGRDSHRRQVHKED
jgi:hypothetical protein